MREERSSILRPARPFAACVQARRADRFFFEVELAPGAKGPPTHTHEEGDEVVEMLAGEVVFRIHGREQRQKAGDRLTLTPADPHTFWNPSKTTPARARVTHGARFERLIAQPWSLLAIARYLTEVDPGASRTHHPLMRVAACA
ncbi:MAG: cupin domain-containing protein [Sandaracinus sp.]|nr:cupin domain-containing protein [Sandaracinus sp.]